ncbi:MAG: TetR/AcrR family transcriptional regulator [Leptospiraceae bacterium]|nr:TetR/AcrR family transcriptional regulator [Leptospiraceae bacterium]
MVLEPSEFDTKERILKVAASLFKQLGFSKVTIDDIISNLKISKKTVYKYFKSKKQIMSAIIKNERLMINAEIQNIIDDQTISIKEKLKNIVDLHQDKQSADVNFLYDLKNKFPDIYNEHREYKRKQLPKNIEKIIEIGIQKKEIDSNINKEFIGLLCLGAAEAILRPEVLRTLPFNVSEAIDEIFNTIFFGIFIRKE